MHMEHFCCYVLHLYTAPPKLITSARFGFLVLFSGSLMPLFKDRHFSACHILVTRFCPNLDIPAYTVACPALPPFLLAQEGFDKHTPRTDYRKYQTVEPN